MALTVLTTSQIINQLDSGSHWTSSTITYSLPTSKTFMKGSSELNSFTALSTTQQVAMANLAITLWADLIAKPVVSNGTGSANITMGYFLDSTGSDYAHTYFPTTGSVWFNRYFDGTHYGTTNDLVHPTIGMHGFATFIHELGHAFGLEHAGNYNAGAGTPEPGSYQDSTVYSIMSYFGPSMGDGVDSNTGKLYSTEIAWGNWLGYDAQTPMLDDILTMQNIYGVSTTTRTGDTVYGFNSTVTGPEAAIYNFSQNAHPIMCVFDSSGNDTLDLSGYTTNSTVDLHSGAFSSFDGMINNFSIAYSCTIENAIGGSGNDTLTANDAGDVLKGNAGNDTLIGGAGNDTLSGDAGNDVIKASNGSDIIDGGADTDTLIYSGAYSAYTITWDSTNNDFLVKKPDGSTDTVTNVENFQFSDVTKTAVQLQANTGTGTGTNPPPPPPAQDHVAAIASNPAVTISGTGTTLLTFDIHLTAAASQAETVNYVIAGSGSSPVPADLLSGPLTGTASFAAGDTDQTITIALQNLGVTSTTSALSIALSNPSSSLVVDTSSATTTISSPFKVINGSTANNTLNGSTGADKIFGLAGNDTINGGKGNDIIVGGAGADKMTGGAGNDIFVLTALSDAMVPTITTTITKGRATTTMSPVDLITDFTSGQDKIDLSLIDAISATSGDDAFHLTANNGNDAFTNSAGELHWYIQNRTTFVEGDVNGDGQADFQIQLTGNHPLTASDFIL